MDPRLAHATSLLGADRTDEERFVGLLLASQLMREPADLRAVFAAAMPFVLRLLNSAPPPAADGANLFRSVALSVLASFGSDEQLRADPALAGCAAAAAATLSDPAATDAECDDGASVVRAVASSAAGLEHMGRTRMLSVVLARAAATPAAAPSPTAVPPGEPAAPMPAGGEGGAQPAGPSAAASRSVAPRACALLVELAPRLGGSASSPSSAELARAELRAAALRLARALSDARDAASFDRLGALEAVMSALAAVDDADADDDAMDDGRSGGGDRGGGVHGGYGDPLSEALRGGLGPMLGSKLPPAPRAAAVRAAELATRVCGPLWLLGPSPLAAPREPPAPGTDGADADAADAAHPARAGGGALLSLLLQLSAVELAMCLYDQPTDDPPERARATLPACCATLEEAMFRLHSDAETDGAAEVGDDPWLEALSDDELISAQRAFHSAVGSALDYCEAVRSEAGTADAAGATHVLLLPICRLLTAWLAQPSAHGARKLHDRACALLPMLRSASAAAGAPWAERLAAYVRPEPTVRTGDHDGGDDGVDGGGAPPDAESMAALFSRLMPERVPADADAAKKLFEAAAAGAGGAR